LKAAARPTAPPTSFFTSPSLAAYHLLYVRLKKKRPNIYTFSLKMAVAMLAVTLV
jgi:hypothetical protein